MSSGPRRRQMLKRDFYRATHTVKVFERLGYEITHRDEDVLLMKLNGSESMDDEIMLQAKDVGILYMEIQDDLDRIDIPYAIFDKLYDLESGQ